MTSIREVMKFMDEMTGVTVRGQVGPGPTTNRMPRV